MSETGHPINLRNFDTLIKTLTSFGARYNPSNPDLKITSLQSLYNTASAAMKGLGDAKTSRSVAENSRKALFAGLETLTRRIIASAKSAAATPEQLADMDETARKIKGDRAGVKNPDPVNPQDPHSISVSQQSYTNLASHLGGLIQTLNQISAYQPNETELQIGSLQALRQDMDAANSAITDAGIAYNAAKNDRDNSMYGTGAGLVDIASLAKDYVFSASKEGTKGADYKALKGISFTRPRK